MIDVETKTFLETWEQMVRYKIATDEELNTICDIYGESEKTLNDVIYARTGYADIDDYKFFEVICEEADKNRRF